MSPRADVSIERRAQILDAATTVFARKGFDAASMDEIVTESGWSKGALYWYFKSKDEIITALLDRFFGQEMEQLGELVRAEGSAREASPRIRADDRTSDEADNTTATHRVRVLCRLLFATRRLKKQSSAIGTAIRKPLSHSLSKASPAANFARRMRRRWLLPLGAMVEGTYLLWVLDPKVVSLEPQLVRGIELLLDGLRAEPLGAERVGMENAG